VADATPRFVFNLKRTMRDREGYYMTRWDRAVPVEIEATNEDAAYQALWAMSGECPRSGFVWTARITKVTGVAA